jgi:protein-S-isoprenylcysteine O-methyltransferase Ste14
MPRLWSTLRSLFFAALFIALQVWYLPQWLGIHGHWHAAEQAPARWIGLVPMVFGAIVMLTCVLRFGTTGEGTPMPLDPPRKFVAVGPYRYVRNPMYLGMGLFLIGEAVLFADRANLLRILWYGLALVVITECFVLFYEEPALRRRFGLEYDGYCRRVPRWLPRKP